jgi:antitoxin HicB
LTELASDGDRDPVSEDSQMSAVAYPAVLTRADEGGFNVSFPDVPEALTQGDDRDEALLNARDALETALELYVDEGEDLPRASKASGRQVLVAVSPLATLKFQIYRLMKSKRVRKADLARKLGWHMPQVDRLLDIRHASKLDQIEAAARVLGKEVRVGLYDL